jgi:hypothetical protein
MSEFANDRTTWAGPDQAGPTVLNSIRPTDMTTVVPPFSEFHGNLACVDRYEDLVDTKV